MTPATLTLGEEPEGQRQGRTLPFDFKTELLKSRRDWHLEPLVDPRSPSAKASKDARQTESIELHGMKLEPVSPKPRNMMTEADASALVSLSESLDEGFLMVDDDVDIQVHRSQRVCTVEDRIDLDSDGEHSESCSPQLEQSPEDPVQTPSSPHEQSPAVLLGLPSSPHPPVRTSSPVEEESPKTIHACGNSRWLLNEMDLESSEQRQSFLARLLTKTPQKGRALPDMDGQQGTEASGPPGTARRMRLHERTGQVEILLFCCFILVVAKRLVFCCLNLSVVNLLTFDSLRDSLWERTPGSKNSPIPSPADSKPPHSFARARTTPQNTSTTGIFCYITSRYDLNHLCIYIL